MTSEHGLSLVEVLVACAVFAIAIIGVALMMSSARSFTVAQGDMPAAFYLAQEKLEQLLAWQFSDIPTSGGSCSTPCSYSCSTTCYQWSESLTAGAANAQTFTRETTIECIDESAFLNNGIITLINCPNPPVFKRITVTVTPAMPQAYAQSLQTLVVSLP